MFYIKNCVGVKMKIYLFGSTKEQKNKNFIVILSFLYCTFNITCSKNNEFLLPNIYISAFSLVHVINSLSVHENNKKKMKKINDFIMKHVQRV